ncbi:putative uncharacterized protein DDB_G0282499 [Maniola jurtina]|uniref:putative uncharacterized protein DDB_G0282499 n=1 Tax=Maniola jurtina TaxID=191418 RepID=UPI001E68DA5D|nr:putative uncharacterized protein DDB_G0282499 [Maniola jurtina]
MDSEDLLARENEFKKLNKQLEKKTESLMKEIEHVMQKQDIFSEFSKLTLSPLHRNTKIHCCATLSSSNTTPEKKCTTSHKNNKKVHHQKVPIPNKHIVTNEFVNNNITNANAKVNGYNNVTSIDANRSASNNVTNCTEGTEVNRCGYNNITNCKEDNRNVYNNVTNCTEVNRSGYNNTSCTDTQTSNNRCNCECYVLSSDKKANDFEFLHAFVSVNVKDNVLPTSFMKGNLTVENVCKFLSAKVKLMQEQIDKLQATIDQKAKQCDKHMTHLAELESERLTLLNRANSMRADTAHTKAKHAAAQNRFAEKDRLYKEQRSVTDKLTNELKQLKCKNASLEARCASQDESITTLKQQLETAKMTEKEFRDSTRTLSASHQSTIQRLEARIKTLTLHTDRQTALIDNLKKQNALLQTDGAVKALEKEYCEFLKQDF